ncbi:MAG: putative glycoside hydrolase, partial [Oscillibacter sp.]
MAGSRGYSNYRGRTPPWKVLLIIVLVLVIVGAAGFMVLQQYIVYDAAGAPHFLLPEKNPTEETPTPDQTEPPIDLTIEGSMEPAATAAVQFPANPADWQSTAEGMTAAGQNAFAVDMKRSGGEVQFASQTPGAALSPTAAAASAALPGLLAEEPYAIARLSCFRDGAYAAANVDSAGLKNTGGFLFYDGHSATWLDPGKPAARAYLCALAKECADMGFEEILLTDLSYPTAGKLDKIAYGETMKDQNFALF